MTDHQGTLRRTITLPQLVLYGLGTTIGAGIYALAGEVAGLAGYGAPLSFLVASLLAGFTALSFAELSGRYPRAAGAAMYVQQGFARSRLATGVGLLVALAGVVSAAALVNAFVRQALTWVSLPETAGIALTALLVTLVAAKGIRASVMTAALITVVEISGLLMVIWVSRQGWLDTDSWAHIVQPSAGDGVLAGVFAGAVLAFYAFIGFEDMVDVSEEVRHPQRTMPTAILLTLGSVTLLYVMIMLAAVLAAPPERLASESAPLVFLFRHYSGGDGLVLAVIGLFAIINGALIQTVMASRVLYGLADRGQLPAFLASVSVHTRTPLPATFIAGTALLALAMAGDLSGLAEATSLLMLAVFTLVNGALYRLKRNSAPSGGFRVPIWVPAFGAVTCAGFLLARFWQLA